MGPTMENRQKLRLIMAEHDLKCGDVAVMVGASKNTVRQWASKSGSNISDQMIELLQYKINEKK